jgi:hypothetical protein
LIIAVVLVADGQLVEVSSDVVCRARVDVPVGLPIGIHPIGRSGCSSGALLLNTDEVWVVALPALVRTVASFATKLTLGAWPIATATVVVVAGVPVVVIFVVGAAVAVVAIAAASIATALWRRWRCTSAKAASASATYISIDRGLAASLVEKIDARLVAE